MVGDTAQEQISQIGCGFSMLGSSQALVGQRLRHVLESCSEHLGGPKKHHKSLHTAAACVGDRIENTKWRIGNFLFLMENGSEIALMFGINILNARSS